MKNPLEHLRHMAEVRHVEDDRIAAAWAVMEIESLRKQWADGVTLLIKQAIENKRMLDDATARLERAGL